MKMNLLKSEKLLAVAIAASACVCMCMWGCGDKLSFDWGKYRSDESIVGFIDDSLVIVIDCRRWHEITEGWNGSYSEETSCGHDRMLIYNYRVQEEEPRWMDSLTNKSGSDYWKQLTDSIVWRWEENGRERIKFWKIGQGERDIKLKKIIEGCSQTFEIKRMRQWLDGHFIALGDNRSTGGDSCQYAVLDTVSRTLIYKRLDKNLEWIRGCNDVRAWGDDVYCVILDDDGEKSLVLKNENDTIPTPRKFAIGGFWGDMIKLSGNICNINNDEITCSDVIWYGNELKFYRDNEVVVDLNLGME